VEALSIRRACVDVPETHLMINDARVCVRVHECNTEHTQNSLLRFPVVCSVIFSLTLGICI
jgi:hypothetical protein